MKIKFKNFKQHVDREFILPDKGLVLLDGGSGAGKTSLLRGIQQALFDSVKKPYTFGSKSCAVELEISGLNIMRQKGPGRLVVNGKEDASAQDLIHTFLSMNESEFMASSYIQQKMQSSLLTLSPAEQLAFIEKLAFGNNSPEKFKEAINNLILVRKKDVETVGKKAEMIDGMITAQEITVQSLQSQLLSVEELDPDYVAETKDVYEYYKKYREEALEKIAELNAEKNKQEYKEIETIEKEIIKLKHLELLQQERLNELEKEIIESGTFWKEMSREKALEELEFKKALPKYLQIVNDLKRNVSRIEEYKAENIKSRTEIEEQLYLLDSGNILLTQDNLKKVLEVEEWIKSRNKITLVSDPFAEKYPDVWKGLKGIKKFEAIKNYLSDLKIETHKLLDLAHYNIKGTEQKLFYLDASQTILYCPVCGTSCFCVNGELIKSVEENEAEKEKELSYLVQEKENEKKLQIKMTGLVLDLHQVDGILEEIAKFPVRPNYLANNLEECKVLKEQYLNEIKRHEEMESRRKVLLSKLEMLDKGFLSKRLEEEIEIKTKEKETILNAWPVFENLDSNISLSENAADIKFLENYIAINDENESKYFSKLQQKQKEFKILENTVRQIADTERTIKQKWIGLRSGDEINGEIRNAEAEAARGLERTTALKPFLDQILVYEQRKKQNQLIEMKINAAKDNVANLLQQKEQIKNEEKLMQEKLEGVLKLKQFSETAQMESVASVVESINIAAKEFLDVLFPEEPIQVTLLPYKQTKDANNVKAKFSTNIKYKGCEYTDIDEVSGGEYDRIVLAYQLALNTIYASPLLLLDEAFTGVEDSLFQIAMEQLKVISQNKLVLVISHGANKGIFDEVIEL